MSHANLAKPEVKISFMKASRYSQPDLEMLAGLQSLVLSDSILTLSSTLLSYPSEPDVVGKSFLGASRQSKINQLDCARVDF